MYAKATAPLTALFIYVVWFGCGNVYKDVVGTHVCCITIEGNALPIQYALVNNHHDFEKFVGGSNLVPGQCFLKFHVWFALICRGVCGLKCVHGRLSSSVGTQLTKTCPCREIWVRIGCHTLPLLVVHIKAHEVTATR